MTWHHSIGIKVLLSRRGRVSSIYLYTLDRGRESTAGHHCKLYTVQSHTQGQRKYICTICYCHSKEYVGIWKCYFHLSGTCHITGNQWIFMNFFWKQLRSRCFFFFPPMMWQVTVKYPTSVGYNFCLTQEERLSQRSVAILNKGEEKKKKAVGGNPPPFFLPLCALCIY